MTLMNLFRSRCIRCYLAGLTVLSGTIIVVDALNPRSIPRGSWFDPVSIPLAGIGVMLCFVAPFLSARPIDERVGFALVGLGGAFLTVVATWMFTAVVFGAVPL
jgi:hypothetical protein